MTVTLPVIIYRHYYFVDRVWVTEDPSGNRGLLHHLGRWRLQEDSGGERWSTAVVKLEQAAPGQWMMRQVHGIRPFASSDPDSLRIHWEDAGVHQNTPRHLDNQLI